MPFSSSSPLPLPPLCSQSLPSHSCPLFPWIIGGTAQGQGVLLAMTFLGSKMQLAKRLLDGVLNENGAPSPFI